MKNEKIFIKGLTVLLLLLLIASLISLQSVKTKKVDLTSSNVDLATKVEQLELKVEELQSVMRDKDSLYTKLAATLHKIKKEKAELEERLKGSRPK